MTSSVVETSLASGTDLDGLGRLFAISPLRGTGATPEGYLLVGKEEMLLLNQAEAVVGQEFRFLLSAGIVLMIMAWLFGHYALIRTISSGWVEPDSG